MSSIAVCECGSIGAPSVIRFAACHHRYFLGDRQLDSVSKVISQVYPKKSFDAANPAVVKHARERGTRVDNYLAQYVTAGNVAVLAGEWVEVLERLERCINWWDRNMNGAKADCQRILYSERDGVAGMADFVIGDYVLDLKNTYSPEPTWKLQIGAYGEYGNASRLGILHSTKDAVRLLEYDAEQCRGLWSEAIRWRAAVSRMEAK